MRVTIAQIQQATAQHFGLKPEHMTCPSRAAIMARPRQIAMYVAHQLIPDASYTGIGRRFGNRDHTTVSYAVSCIHRMRRQNAYIGEHDTFVGTAIDEIFAKLGI